MKLAASVTGLWNSSFHYFNLYREEFFGHCRQRPNVESTFSAIKRKFGDSRRAKTDITMRNETLAKFVCDNLCCLIQSMQEFGIDASFRCQPLAV
jgi:hypothetical protein